MNARVAELLKRLYPPAWQVRYGEEFMALLEERPVTMRVVFDVIGCALYERVSSIGVCKMSKSQHSFVLIVYAYLAAILAGINLYGTVDDTPLIAAMQSHAALSRCWGMIETGSVLALLAVLAMALPVFLAMIRFALDASRRDIIARLVFPFCVSSVPLFWVVTVGLLRAGHKAPIPWAITGDVSGWTPSVIDWSLGSITLVLVATALVCSAISIKQAIDRTDFSEQQITLLGHTLAVGPLQLAKIPTLVVAAAIVLMAASVAGWGLLANQYVPAAFHARFGPLESTTLVSWLGSLSLFIASSVAALRSAWWSVTSSAQ
jgi:hypothetical protein